MSSEPAVEIPADASDEILRRHDITCDKCGARSRAGYVVPESRCPDSMPDLGGGPIRPHEWSITEGEEVGDSR